MQQRADRRRRRGGGAAARRRAALQRAGHTLAAITILHGAVALLVGWVLDVPFARGSVAGLQPTAPLTAAGFAAVGAAVLLLERGHGEALRMAGRALAALVVVLGAVVLLEHVTGAVLATERLALTDRLAGLGEGEHGFPAPGSALCFVLLGGALLTLRPTGQRSPLLEWLTLPAGFIPLQAMIGYAYGAEPLYRVALLAPFPLATAAGFLMVATAVLCLRPTQGLAAQLTADDAGGFVARRLLVVSVLVPLIIGWIGLQALQRELYSLEVGIALIVAGAIFGVAGAAWTSTRVLSRADRRRRAAGAALRASVARLRRAVELSPFPLMIHAEDGRILQISRAWTDLTGYRHEDIPTIEAWTTRAYGRGAGAVRANMDRLYELDRRVTNEGETGVRTRDGRIRTWLFSSAPLGRLRDGRRLMITAAADVTERTETESRLRTTNQRLAFLFGATSHLLASRDPKRLLEDVYGELAKLVGLDVYLNFMAVDADGVRRLRLVACAGITDEQAETLRWVEFGRGVCGTAAARRKRMVAERVHRSKDALSDMERAFGLRAYACHPLIAGDELVGTLQFGTRQRDRFTREELTLLQAVADQVALALDRTRAYELERSARTTAEHASRAKDQFLAVVSHELRTPLTAVVGYTDLLQADVAGPLSHPQRRFVERIRESAWSLASVIDEILTFARTQARQEEVRRVHTDAVRVASEVVASLHPEALRKGLTLRSRLPDEPRIVNTDSAKLRRILTNLVGNAVKFTEEGEVWVDLTFSAGSLRVAVSDTGPGIPPEFLDRVFEPFIQVDASETRTKNGTGLGLTITRELAGLLGGSVTVESELGRGSTFTFELPVAAPR
jgi:PAS domain S-box-containing protein